MTLRSELTRLASEHPELRAHIVPLLRQTHPVQKTAGVTSIQEAIRKVQALPKLDTEDGVFWVWEDGTAQQFLEGTLDDWQHRPGIIMTHQAHVSHKHEDQGCWVVAYRGKGLRITKGEVVVAKYMEAFEKKAHGLTVNLGIALILKNQTRILWENPAHR